MKFTLGLFAILAITGLGQAHQFPNFGQGPLHEDLQDFLDLVPLKEMTHVALDYLNNDVEIQSILKYLSHSSLPRDLMVDLEAIPEVINFFNYLHNHGIKIYEGINQINKALKIEELVPPSYTLNTYSMPMRRAGCGLAGFFKDMKNLFHYDDFITLYVKKMSSSPAFMDFIREIKSENTQHIIDKFYVTKSFQTILQFLHITGVNTKIVADIMYVVFGLTVPHHSPKTLMEELLDFLKLLPGDKMLEIMTKYMNEDEKVKHATEFLFTAEFHTLLRGVEALKEHQALVIFLEKAGLPVIEGIQKFHEIIGMEKYVPPNVELLKSNVQLYEVGEGMEGMIKDLYDVLPLDKIDALYEEKMRNSKVFADFIAKIKSPEMQEIINNLYNNETYKDFLVKTKEQGLEFQKFTELTNRIFGITFPSTLHSLFMLF